jgi:hypothetical protein
MRSAATIQGAEVPRSGSRKPYCSTSKRDPHVVRTSCRALGARMHHGGRSVCACLASAQRELALGGVARRPRPRRGHERRIGAGSTRSRPRTHDWPGRQDPIRGAAAIPRLPAMRESDGAVGTLSCCACRTLSAWLRVRRRCAPAHLTAPTLSALPHPVLFTASARRGSAHVIRSRRASSLAGRLSAALATSISSRTGSARCAGS